VQKDFLQHNLPEEDIRLGSRATFSAWRHGGVGLKLRVNEILLERFKRRDNKMTGS